MPRLWSETIEEHRRAVTDAVLDATWALVAERGVLSVTMSQVAEAAGIGRATLYKYFPDVEAILAAGHQRQVAGHLDQLVVLRERGGDAGDRLASVLTAYARMARQRGQHGTDVLVAHLHRGEHVARAHEQLVQLFRELLADAAEAGDIRDDVPPAELAAYCLHALDGAGSLASEAAVHRLVALTLAGLRPRR